MALIIKKISDSKTGTTKIQIILNELLPTSFNVPKLIIIETIIIMRLRPQSYVSKETTGLFPSQS